MTGFKNAPSVTEFKAGMAFVDEGWKSSSQPIFTVVCVKGGTAICTEVGSTVPTRVERSRIPYCTLDPDSIWLGRQYKGKKSGRIWTVAALGPDQIGMVSSGGIGRPMYTRQEIAEHLHPLPLEPAKEASGVAAQPHAEPWKPEAGKECRFEGFGDTVRGVIIGPDPQLPDNWICQLSRPNGERCFGTHHKSQLRPLPAEPPCKVGDYVEVRDRHCNAVMAVGMVRWADETGIKLAHRDNERYLFSLCTITRLVPEGANR